MPPPSSGGIALVQMLKMIEPYPVKEWGFRFISKTPSDLHIAIGDDWTDEDTFAVMPADAITIKVGHAASRAKYHLDTVADVRQFLKKLIE